HLLSPWFGIALIFLGVGVNLYAALRHVQFIGQLKSGEVAYPRPSKRAALLALLLALIGLAMAFYLTFLRTSAEPSVIKASAGQARSVEVSAVQLKEPLMSSPATAPSANEIVSIASNHSVDATVEKLKTMLQAKNVTIFALVDH